MELFLEVHINIFLFLISPKICLGEIFSEVHINGIPKCNLNDNSSRISTDKPFIFSNCSFISTPSLIWTFHLCYYRYIELSRLQMWRKFHVKTVLQGMIRYARFEKKYTSINISNFFGDFRVGKNILKKSEKTDAQKCFTDEERIRIWNTSYSAYWD